MCSSDLSDWDILLGEEHSAGGSLSRLMIGVGLEQDESCSYDPRYPSVKPAAVHREQNLNGHLPGALQPILMAGAASTAVC